MKHLKDFALVFFGAGIGGSLRFGLSKLFAHVHHGTFAVNVVGSLAMGLIAGVLANKVGAEGWRLFLAVGVLGGFTTFSAFSLDAVTLIRSAGLWHALAYVGLSVLLSLLFFAIGLWAGESVSGLYR